MFGVLRTVQHVTAISGQKSVVNDTKVILVWKAGVHIFKDCGSTSVVGDRSTLKERSVAIAR